MAHAMVRELHGENAFALGTVRFMTIMFLDDVDLDVVPTVRVSLQRSHSLLVITSHREDSSWDKHSEMELQVRADALSLLSLFASALANSLRQPCSLLCRAPARPPFASAHDDGPSRAHSWS
jgi:hypothetical protein